MMLGKRQRPPMKRTTSMTEFTLDLSNIEAPTHSNPHKNPIKDHRILSTVSPRNHHRKNIGDTVETPHFLRACNLCKRRLVPGRDIYMYRGDSAFCSSECRQQQMNQDERKEKCSYASKKETSSTTGSEASSKNERMAAA